MISAFRRSTRDVLVELWATLASAFLILFHAFYYRIISPSSFLSVENKMSIANCDEEMEQNISSSNNRKSYAAFLIDRPFNDQHKNQEEKSQVFFMNCLRYRLRIAAENLKTGNNGNINSRVNSLYDTLLNLIDEYDATGIAEIFRLLLERRSSIPLFVPKSKKHYLSLLRHITATGNKEQETGERDNIRLGEDKSLLRVALISCRQRNRSQTCDILKKVFNIDSIHSLDSTARNISSETMLAEIGCGCIVTEGSGSQTVQNVMVVHVIGDFRPLWSFLRRFADLLLIEDSTVGKESFFSSFMTEDKKREIDLEDAKFEIKPKILLNCIWKPSLDDAISELKEINGFYHLYIEDQLSGETIKKFQLTVVETQVEMQKESSQPNFADNRRMLCDIPLLEAEGYSSLECTSPAEIESTIANSVNVLGNVKLKEFLLQKNFMQEAKHEESKMENRLNEAKVNEEDKMIKEFREKRRADTHLVEKNLLLQTFLSFLENKDGSSRFLSIRMLEKELGKRGEQELGPLLKEIKILTASYYEKLHKSVDKKDLETTKENLHKNKTNLIESVLNIEHLWRELSHLYTDMEPRKRSTAIRNIPRLAAQHLLDGFCLELLDGDSNMIRMDWVSEVLHQLGKSMKGKRIFVLSVMGIQSSGKSTLLNTMFGIRMRTSVGQCTRGVNMQLLAVKGRPEYDYILLLDTEGTRSPEYHGLSGSEKRDNQMATLSILLSDATIVVIPGENDAAVKEILPIVLMAYQGSQLAEENGGRLSSRMFFVYNRIDTKQKNKLDNIIQTLGTSLHEAFSQVQNSTGNLTNLKSESPFANFKLVTSDSSGSDVCILGNVKKQSKPPGDVPDEEYGEELIQFREHIHQRVTNVEGGQIWKSRSIEEFSDYIKNVWTCICSANFIFSFATVLEHLTFDKLDLEYKQVERKLAEAYEKSFANVKHKMMKSIEEKKSSVSFEFFENNLRDELYQTEQDLNKEVDELVNKKGQEKWELQFKQMWDNKKKDQAFNWGINLKNAYDRLFNYENRVEKYKKKMRKEINEFFKSPTNSNVSKWTESEKKKKFDEMFKTILDEAKKEFPPKDIPTEINKVYQKSPVIMKRQIEINRAKKILNVGEKNEGKKSHSFKQKFLEFFKEQFPGLFGVSKNVEENKNRNSIMLCAEAVHDTVNRIATGKLCYDDSIISKVIRSVDSTIITYNLTDNSVVQKMHQYGKEIIVFLMENIENEWEAENSVSAKLKSNKEILCQYFVMVSLGVAKTKLFATTMAANLEKSIISAFETEMVQKTFQGIRNLRWLYDARFMQKHMDLYLIDLLEKGQVRKVLENVRHPKEFYADVLHHLIAEKVPKVDDQWQSFKNHVKKAIEKAAAIEIDTGRAQSFIDQLQKEFLGGYLQSESLQSAFRIDCSDEYEDCDNEEKTEFYNACSTKLNEVLEKQVRFKNQENYAEELSPKIVQYMITLNDEAALPRCDACCRMCKSLCIEAANHDTNVRPHDAVHQPGGIAGVNYHPTDKLDPITCSQYYEKDGGFYLDGNYSVLYKYRDFATVFPGWNVPRINEELPLREYILATYNNEIAEKYDVKPADNIPASYNRDLSSIKEQLERETADGKRADQK